MLGFIIVFVLPVFMLTVTVGLVSRARNSGEAGVSANQEGGMAHQRYASSTHTSFSEINRSRTLSMISDDLPSIEKNTPG